jgi:hypothetical protein
MRKADLVGKTVVTFPVLLLFLGVGVILVLLKALFTLRRPVWDILGEMWYYWWKEAVKSKFS